MYRKAKLKEWQLSLLIIWLSLEGTLNMPTFQPHVMGSNLTLLFVRPTFPKITNSIRAWSPQLRLSPTLISLKISSTLVRPGPVILHFCLVSPIVEPESYRWWTPAVSWIACSSGLFCSKIPTSADFYKHWKNSSGNYCQKSSHSSQKRSGFQAYCLALVSRQPNVKSSLAIICSVTTKTTALKTRKLWGRGSSKSQCSVEFEFL